MKMSRQLNLINYILQCKSIQKTKQFSWWLKIIIIKIAKILDEVHCFLIISFQLYDIIKTV